MNTLPDLIRDLTLILIAAAIISLLFRKLRQPATLGYLLAGVLLSPQLGILPTIIDLKGVQIWAEIGVIFLLFAMGLEFSFRKLAPIGGSVIVTGIIEVLLTFAIGYLTGKGLAWSPINCLFLGAVICISSTSIILKTFEEFQLLNKKFAQRVLGILIVEDLMAVLLLAVLPSLHAATGFAYGSLALVTGQFFFLFGLCIILGFFFISPLIRWAKKIMSTESVLLVAVGLCLLMVRITSAIGFSAALGAFLMGSVLGETEERERILNLIRPLRDLFSAVFFVSMGMLVRPQALLQNSHDIFLIFFTVIVAKVVFTTVGSLLAGTGFKTAMESGLSLASIGEFSYLTAGVALTETAVSPDFPSMIIGVSALTALTTPLLIQQRETLSSFFEKWLPKKTKRSLDHYSKASVLLNASSEWRQIRRQLALRILGNSIICIAILLTTSQWLLPFLKNNWQNRHIAQVLALLSTLVFSSPFLWAIIFARPQDPKLRVFLREKVQRRLRQFLSGLRWMIACALLAAIIAQFFSLKYALLGALLPFALFAGAFFKFFGPLYRWLESHLLENVKNSPAHAKEIPVLTPWEAHLAQVVIPQEAPFVGTALEDLHLKEKFGVIVAMIERGKIKIMAPGRQDSLMPMDRVHIIGSDEQIEKFQSYVSGTGDSNILSSEDSNFGLLSLLITETSPFSKKSLKDSGLRNQTQGLIVGVERQGRRITSPDAHFIIQPGDLLWIVGNPSRILNL